ncbi:organic hydroperoxide resistance protein [Dinghuibacter silviterrae]|uniref:Ohr subfamily peroxiredoxin n=1 Tax=Dinghuibacter silviterrae TaxID=1539049 RepID=A0A4R8DTC7_9BACT|nr:organic hydroperoxide resistance protein [Dinghuibacter silviterrae]TDX01552.1 Ohr subfamily peroxiredoxin [Dinghuibacter silviterrae]
MKTLYQTTVSVTGGRNGHVKSEDGILELDVRIPKEMGGAGGHTNPEQLFAAGYAACFDSALNLVMQREKVVSTSVLTATVGLTSNGEGGFSLWVHLAAHLPGVDPARALELVQKAHAICPYSNATRGNIEVRLEVI